MDTKTFQLIKFAALQTALVTILPFVLFNAALAYESVAPCTAENYVAPATQAETSQLAQNLRSDVKLAFQSRNVDVFYGLLCRAAAARIKSAELRLGIIHLRDWGFIKKNDQYARYWLERAAAQGESKAKLYLADLYLEGKGGPLHGSQAIQLLREAALEGEADAMIQLVSEYVEGRFVLQSINTARFWAQRAKQAGHPKADQLLNMLDRAPPSMRR